MNPIPNQAMKLVLQSHLQISQGRCCVLRESQAHLVQSVDKISRSAQLLQEQTLNNPVKPCGVQGAADCSQCSHLTQVRLLASSLLSNGAGGESWIFQECWKWTEIWDFGMGILWRKRTWHGTRAALQKAHELSHRNMEKCRQVARCSPRHECQKTH